MEAATDRPEAPRRGLGVEANARLTAWAGALLLPLLAVEAGSVPRIRQHLPLHIFVGLVLVPPLLLKFGSTGYRFAAYYLRSARYRAAGPPDIALRLLAPVLVISTLVLFATGIELWLFGLRFGVIWLALHKGSFLVWFFACLFHVAGHLERTPALVRSDLGGSGPRRGRVTRGSLVGAALLLGVVLALATLPFASPFVVPAEG